jgi:hypothetical protein
VLPVKSGARLEVSNDAFFAALDASTQPVVLPPAEDGGTGVPGGCFALGCGSSSSNTGSASPPGAVQVVSEGVAGIYETVTLHGSDPSALTDWLTQNGYDIPSGIAPTLNAYIQEGFDFIALRLRPECGSQAMQPVRVVTPGTGANLTLPLRMVAAGVASNVGITLYVIGEGRYHPQNFPDALIDYSQLTWSLDSQSSNYLTLASTAMGASAGYAWITEYAGPAQLQPGTAVPGASSYNPGLADAYFGVCGGFVSDAGPVVTVPCPDGGTVHHDAGPGDAEAGTDEAGEMDASDDADGESDAAAEAAAPSAPCGLDDLDVALVGLTPGDVWLTRLRSLLPSQALASGDLVLEAAPSQTTVTNIHEATGFSDANPASDCASTPRLRETAGTWTIIAVAALGTGALLRRRRRA